MRQEHTSLTMKFVISLFLFIAISLLPSCKSSHKSISSFSKRKYTKGHFYNPVAKLYLIYKPLDTNTLASINITSKKEDKKKTLNKEIEKTLVKYSQSVQFDKLSVLQNQKKWIRISNNKSGTVSNKENLSLNENSTLNTEPYGDHTNQQ
jgi:hypothetical protein